MYCFLKTCRNQKWSYIPLLQLHKFYDCPYVYLYRDLYFSCGLQLMSSVLSFQTEGLPILKHFFQRRSNSNKLPQVLFIWECVNFSLIFKGQFCQIQDSWLTFFFFFLLALRIRCLTTFIPPQFLMKNLLTHIPSFWALSPSSQQVGSSPFLNL